MDRAQRTDGRLLAAATAILVILATFPAMAQEGFDVQRFNPMPSQTTNHFSLASAEILQRAQWEIGLLGNYANDPLVLTTANDVRVRSIVESQVALNLLGAVGIADIMDVGIDLGLIVSQSGDSANAGRVSFPTDASNAEFGVADIRLVPKFQLLNTHTEDDPGGGAIAVLLNTYFPTGDSDVFQGENFRIEPRFAFDLISRAGSRVSLNLGYMIRDDQVLGNAEVDDMLTFGLGFDLVASPEFHVVPEFNGAAMILADELDAEEVPFEAILGFKVFPIEMLLIEFGAGTGLVEGVGSPDWRAFFGAALSPVPSRDPDGDGIFGDDDACPYDPEDFDGFEDEDGCPDVDNDRDGILDVYDDCPMDPEDVDGFEDEDGCPDLDNDADGIRDVDDQCPLDPEDYDTWEDEDGCPDPDNDNDGILDVDDDCPLDPETFDGWLDEDGCPDPDNDEDRILDDVDECPGVDGEAIEDIAEVWNGFEDEDGCPDEGIVRVTCDRIEIDDKIYFARNSDEIRRRSFDLLNTLSTVIRSRPDILLIRIEGHTSTEGSAEHNLDLSRRRAASVRNWLVESGVPPSRLISEGYGETQPIILDDRTEAQREENRRVEFVIMEQEGCRQ